MAVRIPAAGGEAARADPLAQFVQSHALSFFHLSAPDLLLGMDSDPAKRNVAGLLEEHPDALRDGIALRKFGQQVIERLAQGAHPPVVDRARRRQRAARPARPARRRSPSCPRRWRSCKRTLALWKKTVDGFPDEIDSFSNFPTMYCGLVGPDGSLRLYDGNLRFVGPDGSDRRRPGGARRLRDVHRRGDAAGLVPEGAVLQAGRLSPTASTASARWRGSTSRTGAARPRRTPSSRSTARRFGPHRPERVPLPLRPPDRGPLRPRADAGSCSTTRPSSGPRSAPTRASTTSRASASSRPRAARSSTTTRWTTTAR